MLSTRFELEENIVLLTTVGSMMYGTNIEGSDVDIRGICIGPKDFYLGLKQSPYYLQEKNQLFHVLEPCKYDYLTDKDCKVLELSKMIELLIGNNPNCLDLLYSNKYLVLHDVVLPLINIRDKFLCKRARFSYGEYAKDQIEKCNTHRGWLLELKSNADFYIQRPNPIDYGLDENLLRKDRNMFLELLYVMLVDAKTFHLEREPVLQELFSKVDFKGLLLKNYFPDEASEMIRAMVKADANYMDYLKRIKTYLKDLDKYNQFKSWKANRNPKRAELEAKCLFDSKHLSHSIRLYSMAIEIVQSQQVIVDRRITGDAEYLKDIRKGNISYEEVVSYITKLEDKLMEAFKTTKLPDKPDLELINNVQMNMIESWSFNK